MVNLSPEIYFDALTCFVNIILDSANSSHVTFRTQFLLGIVAV